MIRLSMDSAARSLQYDRGKVTPGIVHLGVGAFQRAHIAAYVDALLPSDPGWGIIGASLRRPDTRQALLQQDFLYTLVTRSAEGTQTRVIGSLLEVLDAATQRNQLLEAMTDPRIRIVSLTVTEKGYCHHPSTGKLDAEHPDIKHDLANPAAPVSAPGLIVRALELRRKAGIAPFTVLSCDNLPANGKTASAIVNEFASLISTELSHYIRDEVAFPSTMVDRIVPATTEEDRALVLKATGLHDAWPVVTEPFTQWVVEDHFPSGRPLLENVGVEFVKDVAPFELMKLRMLNGSHSTLAYLGNLAGHEYVSDAIADPAFRSLIHRLMTVEVMPTLRMNPDDLAHYRDALLNRFLNPALKHRTSQIAMDGSQKLPQRLLGTIRDLIRQGQQPHYTVLGVASWIRYAAGINEMGKPIEVKDPLSQRMQAIANEAGRNPDRLVDGFLSLKEVFGADLPGLSPFRTQLVEYVSMLFAVGAAETVRKLAHV